MVMRQLVLILAPLAASAADWRHSAHLRRTPSAGAGGSSAGWQDMTCFMDLARFGLTASKDDVVFRSGQASGDGMPEVLVVEDKSKIANAPRRTLVFRSADGKCNEQAGTVCAVSKSSRLDSGAVMASGDANSAFAADADLLSPNTGSTLDKCSTMACAADVAATLREPGAGYVRSMVGAAALLPGASNTKRQFLSIGLGAGTLPVVLQQAFPGSQQTVVELSPDVAAAAQCFGASSVNGIDITTGDGRAYLEAAADGSFDAVFLDAFDASDKVPSCFVTGEFFRMAKRKLKSGGLLVMNAHSGITLHNDVKDLLPAAQAAFGQGSRLQLGKAPGLANAIVVAQAEYGHKDTSAFAQDASSELASWFQEAEFTAAQSSHRAVLTDAAVKCSVR